MKVLLQRVARASVRVGGDTVASIGTGLLVLVGVEREDTEAEAEEMAARTVDLRVFSDDEGRMNRSVREVDGSVLVVSQFTLAASTRKGRRPSFHAAASPAEGERLYGVFADAVSGRGVPVARGVFGARMEVELVNDGPVTVMLEPRGAGGGR